jgi:hypothetical protein
MADGSARTCLARVRRARIRPMTRRHRVPPGFGPYASCLGGEWRSHESARAALERVEKAAGDRAARAVRVEGEWGYRLSPAGPPSAGARRPSGPSGKHGPRVTVDLVTTERREAYERAARAADVTISEWLRRAGDAALSRSRKL